MTNEITIEKLYGVILRRDDNTGRCSVSLWVEGREFEVIRDSGSNIDHCVHALGIQMAMESAPKEHSVGCIELPKMGRKARLETLEREFDALRDRMLNQDRFDIDMDQRVTLLQQRVDAMKARGS